MAPSSSDSESADRKTIFEDSVDYSQHSDPEVNTAILPDDHPIHLLDVAREHYKGQKPPFVLGNRPETAKTVVIPTKSGQRPVVPKRVEVVAKPWDAKNMFWTLDLNNIRYIVKPFGGAPQAGAKYLYWAGPEIIFEQKPLAFTELNARPFHDVTVVTDEAPSDQGEDDEGDVPSDQSPKAILRTLKKEASLPKRNQHESMPALAQRLLDLGAVPTPPDSESAIQSTDSTGCATAKNALKKGNRPTKHSDLPPRRAVEKDEPAASHSAPAKRRKTDISVRELKRLNDQATFSFSRGRRQARATSERDSSSSPNISIDRAAQPNQVASVSNISSQQPAMPSIVLPETKQKCTTLIVRVAPNAEYQPLKLTECFTMRTFYAQILGLWDIGESEVDKVTVTFTWMDPNDRMRVMVVNRQQDAHFLHILEQVDECPCWQGEEKGKCMLDVDILLK